MLEPRELARTTVAGCRELLGVDGTAVFRFNRDRGLLEPLDVTANGVVEDTLMPGQGAIGLAFSERKQYAIDDYVAWQSRLATSVDRGLKSVMTVPLISGDIAVGALGVWSTTPRTWTPDERQVVSLIAAQVGPGLGAAEGVIERERQAERLRALNAVAVAAAGVLEPRELARIAAECARDLLRASSGAATWYDARKGGLRILADTDGAFDPEEIHPVAGAGAQGLSFETGEPVVIEDYASWSRRVPDEVGRVGSALAVPLLVRQERIGTLAVSFAERHQFGAEDVQLLQLLASEIAPSMEAARLYADLRESEARKRSLVDSSLNGIIASDETGQITDFNAAAERMFGYRPEEAVLRSLWELIIPTERQQPPTGYPDFIAPDPRAPGRRLETYATRADGTQFPAEVSLAAFEQDGKIMFSASIRDLSERVEAEAMRQESEAKSRFVAAMSHELRTPLNSILGFSQLLAGAGAGDLNDRQLRYVGHIETSGRHLLALINDVLDLSKVEAGQMEVELEPIELQPLLDEAVSQVKPMADIKPLDVLVEPMPPIWIRADRRRFLQVMLNLLSNAIKFTPPGGLIKIGAVRAGRSAEIAVSDTGIGIPAADRERIFEEFTQVERPAAEQAEGTGLGLALSQRLLQLMRATIKVESEEGVGSTFTITIPRIRPGEVADARPTLLVVPGPEEDPTLLARLELSPYRVIAAATAREAAIIARRRRLSGIVIGTKVPAEEEEWLRAALRDHPRTHTLPILSAAVALHPGVLIRD
jgi:PAS domain S-box-containing protein